jgi:glycosyltransferase involved in cell wall biosynthesis
MNARALVSVIVPTRNSSRTLNACLVSIRSQLYRPIEIVVVDNGSTDHTLEIAQRHGDIVESFGPERSAQRNHGASLAHGEFLLFVDSDMTLAPRVVGDCLEAVMLTGAPGVVIPETSVGDGFWARCRALERSCYVGDDAIEAARFFTRGAFEASEGFDEDLTGPEDWDLSVRIAAGSTLPRTPSYISHDEGRLRIRTIVSKKRYYAKSSLLYLQKRGVSKVSQANMVFRPAFLRNRRRLVRHPVLASGIFAMKSLEATAVMWGFLSEWASARRDPQTKSVSN